MFKTSILALLLVFCFLPASPSFSFEAKGQDCAKCHTLSDDEARDLLKGIIRDITVISVNLSPVQGVWEVYLDSRGRKVLIYVDFGKKHFFMGSLISIEERKNLTKERFAELNPEQFRSVAKVDVSQIPLNDALVLGDPKARIRVISFHDPD
jgi:thiol:disulfide interchange protein DsbC